MFWITLSRSYVRQQALELLEQYLMRGRAYILATVKKTDILEDTQTENLRGTNDLTTGTQSELNF